MRDGCVLIDTGLPGSAAKLMKASASADIRHILLTHAHPDHIGSFAAINNLTGAEAYMHPADAEIATSGRGFRLMQPAPGLLHGIMFRLFVRPVANIEGAPIEHLSDSGQYLQMTVREAIASGDSTDGRFAK